MRKSLRERLVRMSKNSSENLSSPTLSTASLPEVVESGASGDARGETLKLPARSGVDSVYSTQSGEGDKSLDNLASRPLKDIIENYLSYYAAGAEDSGSQIVVKLSDWTLQSTKNFVDSRLALGESPATVSRRLATVKHFGRTLAERFHGFINPAREARAPSFKTTNPGSLDAEEIQLLLLACRALREKSETFINGRNALLVELLLSTGLRADEVRLLTWGQVSEDFSWLKGVKTKGKKFRNVYLDSEVRSLLFNYREACLAEYANKFPPLGSADLKPYPAFPSFYRANAAKPKSFHLSPKSVWRIVSDLGKSASALRDLSAEGQSDDESSPKKSVGGLHPHKLRHTFAHGLLDSSKDIRLVAQALGHSDVRTTMRYTERGDEEIAQAIEEKLNRGS